MKLDELEEALKNSQEYIEYLHSRFNQSLKLSIERWQGFCKYYKFYRSWKEALEIHLEYLSKHPTTLNNINSLYAQGYQDACKEISEHLVKIWNENDVNNY